jgi:uncharacterized membrane protein YccF (DUF307 family)
MLRVIGNFLWFILGGAIMGLAWWAVGLIAFVSIVGIPWARSCFVIGQLMFLPFGRDAISRLDLTGHRDVGTGFLGLLGNVVWFVLFGIWLAIGHLICAVVDCLLIVGIPFGIQHLKLAGLALAPVGKSIVHKEVAAAARRYNAEAEVRRRRNRYYGYL